MLPKHLGRRTFGASAVREGHRPGPVLERHQPFEVACGEQRLESFACLGRMVYVPGRVRWTRPNSQGWRLPESGRGESRFRKFLWLPDPSWAGLYLLKGAELVLGPFQGRPACVRITVGAGVCGTTVREQRSQVAVDVHASPGHIACGPASRWEIVVPIREADGRIVAVLDLDSDRPGTFGELDRAGLEMLVTDLALRIDWVAAGVRPVPPPVAYRVQSPGSRLSPRAW